MKRLPLLIASVTLIAGCFSSDWQCGGPPFSTKLAGDYYIHRYSANEVKVSPRSYGKNTPVIPPVVVALGHDDRFIIAKQNHLRRRSPDNPEDTYMERDPGVYSYWIIDTSIPRAYGPLTKVEFEEKRKELLVPEELMMRSAHSYKP